MMEFPPAALDVVTVSSEKTSSLTAKYKSARNRPT